MTVTINGHAPLNMQALNEPERENTKVPCAQASQAALPFLPALRATVLEDEPLSRMNLARSCRGVILQHAQGHTYTPSIYSPCIVLYKGTWMCMHVYTMLANNGKLEVTPMLAYTTLAN